MEKTITIARDQSGDYQTVQGAIDSLPENNLQPVTLLIMPGVYREKIVLNRDYVTLKGQGEVRLVYGDYALQLLPDGTTKNTFLTAALLITGHDVTVRNLTVENDAGDGRKVGQAVAVYAAGDRVRFFDCRLIAAQDTLFCGDVLWKLHQYTLPRQIPQGVEGVADKPAIDGRQYYEHCYIQGDVDFIFGPYRCWFEDCTLYANRRGGYYTAANTPEGQPFGLVFHRCKLTGECEPGMMYLGRPWREHAATAFLNCQMDECVHPAGFTDWEKPFRPVTQRYCEYGSTGAGADTAYRHPGMKLLTAEEAQSYTLSAVLGGSDGWNPRD